MTEPTHLDRLINRHMNALEIRRRLAEQGDESARGEALRMAEGPWVTISQQRGSGGSEIARLMGERVGWQVFDKEILEAIAREERSRELLFSHLDEKTAGLFDDLAARWVVPDRIGPSDFIQEMMRVIWTLARHGEAILVGRGANWLLDARRGLRLRVIAPEDWRAQRLAALESIDPATARRAIQEEDAARKAFVHRWYHRDIEDPLGYDLTLNTGSLSPSDAADAALTALRAKLGVSV